MIRDEFKGSRKRLRSFKTLRKDSWRNEEVKEKGILPRGGMSDRYGAAREAAKTGRHWNSWKWRKIQILRICLSRNLQNWEQKQNRLSREHTINLENKVHLSSKLASGRTLPTQSTVSRCFTEISVSVAQINQHRMLIRYVEIGCCVAQRKSGETVAQVSCIRLPALRPHCLRQQKKDKTKNQNDLHTTFWIIFKRIKKNLVDHQVEKMKIETLNVVDKKQENFLQDMVQICDSTYQETVDASMHAVAQIMRSKKCWTSYGLWYRRRSALRWRSSRWQLRRSIYCT